MELEMQMRIGRNLRLLRECAKLTQHEVAKRLAVGQTFYCHIEQGQKLPDFFSLSSAAQMYHISVDTLLNDDIQEVISDSFLHLGKQKNHTHFLSLYETLSDPGKERLFEKAKELMQAEGEERRDAFRLVD